MECKWRKPRMKKCVNLADKDNNIRSIMMDYCLRRKEYFRNDSYLDFTFKPKVTHKALIFNATYSRPKCFIQFTATGIIAELHLSGCSLSVSPIIRIGLVLQINLSIILPKLTFLEITGYLLKYSTILSLLELHIRRGRKV